MMFLEPKRLYNGPFDGHHDRPVTPWSKHELGEVPEGHYSIPIGKAEIRRPGGCGHRRSPMAPWCMWRSPRPRRKWAIDAEGDRPAQPAAARSRHDRAIGEARPAAASSSHEATLHLGLRRRRSAAWFRNTASTSLEAPVVRVTGWDTPYPHAQEWDYFPGPARVGRGARRSDGGREDGRIRHQDARCGRRRSRGRAGRMARARSGDPVARGHGRSPP